MRRVEGSQIMAPGSVIHHRLKHFVLFKENLKTSFFRQPERKTNKLVLWVKNFEFQAKKIDVFSRVFFPFVFAMFNIWYWSYYLSKATHTTT